MIVLKTGLHEECGVFGIYSPHTTDVAAMTYVAALATAAAALIRVLLIRGNRD